MLDQQEGHHIAQQGHQLMDQRAGQMMGQPGREVQQTPRPQQNLANTQGELRMVTREREKHQKTHRRLVKKAKTENVRPSSPPPPIEMSAEQFKQTGYSLLGNTKSPT